jgi:hypothetical protein
LIFLCFVSFYQACPVLFREKEMKRVKRAMPGTSKVKTLLVYQPDSIQPFYLMKGKKYLQIPEIMYFTQELGT